MRSNWLYPARRDTEQALEPTGQVSLIHKANLRGGLRDGRSAEDHFARTSHAKLIQKGMRSKAKLPLEAAQEVEHTEVRDLGQFGDGYIAVTGRFQIIASAAQGGHRWRRQRRLSAA